MRQSAVSAQTLAGQRAVQPGSARLGPTHECNECREGSRVENPSADDWSIPEGASLRRVDDATGECTDDWSIPEASQNRPSLRRVQGTELPIKSNGNAQGEWDSPRNQRADSRGSFGASAERLSGGMPPKSLGKSLSTQVLGAGDRGQRGVHPQARVGSSPSTHTLAQLGEGDVRIVSLATDAVSRPRNILQPTIVSG
jgi:hypothetical protein